MPTLALAAAIREICASRRIDKRIADLGDWRGERLAEIRALIHEVDPDVVEEWKWMGSPVWSHEGMYALANAHKDKVKLTFHHGAQLPDPRKLFNAGLDGNKWRAIDYREGDKIDKTALTALLNVRSLPGMAQAIQEIEAELQVRAADDAPMSPLEELAMNRRLGTILCDEQKEKKAAKRNGQHKATNGKGGAL